MDNGLCILRSWEIQFSLGSSSINPDTVAGFQCFGPADASYTSGYGFVGGPTTSQRYNSVFQNWLSQ